MAPEIIEGSYNNKCDIWSVGVSTYYLITGEPPFKADNISELENKICNIKRFSFKKLDFIVSQECEDFIGDLMTMDSKIRPSADEALNHPFLNSQRFLSENSSFR